MSPYSHRLFLGLMVLRFGLVPLVHGGIFARVHDNLDSTLVYNVLMARFWRGGMDHSALDLHLNGVLDWTHFATLTWPILLPYVLFSPAWAYAITEIAIVTLAYLGMFALLRDLHGPVAPNGSEPDRRDASTALMACLFAMTLSFSSLGLGVAAAPLVVLLALRGGGGWRIAAMFVIGWNSSLIGHAMFLPAVVLAVAVAHRRDWRPAVLPLAAYLAGSIVGSLPLFAHVLGDYQGHRSLWTNTPPALDPGLVIGTLATGLLTQGAWYHATIIPVLYTAVFLIAGMIATPRVAIAVLTIVLGALVLELAAPWLRVSLPGPLASIQFDRIGQFAALLIILLGAAVAHGQPVGRPARWVRGAAVLTLVQAMLVWSGVNLATLTAAVPPAQRAMIEAEAARDGWFAALRQSGIAPRGILAAVPTVQRHLRTADYRCIAGFVAGRAVASAGPDPMLAPLHGIPALDGYHYLYPAHWHAAFRPVIAAKLAASEDLRAYFDGWGNRVSLFIDHVPEILPDFDALRSIGGAYVIADRALPLEQVHPDGCELSPDLRLYRL